MLNFLMNFLIALLPIIAASLILRFVRKTPIYQNRVKRIIVAIVACLIFIIYAVMSKRLIDVPEWVSNIQGANISVFLIRWFERKK